MTNGTPAHAHDGALEIKVEGLKKAFGTRVVLDGIDLVIARGEVVAIVGGSGCGKTVLLDHIIGHLTPDAGVVLVADHDAPGAPLRDLGELNEEEMDHIRVHWSVVFQRNALFSGTVFENIALWHREIKDLDDETIAPIARAALVAVGFDEPDVVLERDRDELSGGMAKRVAVARALSMDPMLLFYDEPTTGLDPTHASQIHDLIARTHTAGDPRTTVIITHDKDLLRRLEPRIIMLYDGRVYFDGDYAAFHASGAPMIRPYFDLMPALQLRPTRTQ